MSRAKKNSGKIGLKYHEPVTFEKPGEKSPRFSVFHNRIQRRRKYSPGMTAPVIHLPEAVLQYSDC